MVRPAAKKEKPALQDAVKKHGSLNKFRQICRFTNLNVEEIAQRGETWRHRVLPVGVFPMSDNRTAFLIADVCGKGLGAALLTTMLQGALSGLSTGSDPARVLHQVNCFLCEHSEVGRYATMFFGVLDRDGRLEFINAGHPSPLLLRRGEVTEPFTEGSLPVGLIPGTHYDVGFLQLQPDDTLVLFSDGVSEAMDHDNQMFGVHRLRDSLAGQHDAPLDQIQKAILESVGTFTRGASQADDITLLIVRYRPASRAAAS